MLSTSFTATCPLPSTLLGCHLPAPLHPPLPPRLYSLLCCQSSSALSAVTLSPRLPSPLSSLISDLWSLISTLCLSPLRHSARHRLDTLNCSMIQLLNRTKQNLMIQLWKLIGLVLDFYRHFGAEPAGRSLLNGFFKKNPIVGTLPGLIGKSNPVELFFTDKVFSNLVGVTFR